MKKVLFLLLMWFNLGAISAFSQEICNNGIDDDGDGFIDCYDSDCSNNNACSGYFGNDANCQAIPPEFPQFSMRVDWSSPNGTANHLNRVSIGDLDADGIPEVVSTNIESDRLYILNGDGGTIKRQLAVGYQLEREAAIGNIDGDNCAEIFTFGRENGNWTIFSYDCELNLIWKRRASGNPVTLSLADFDGDGLVELYYRDEILDAHTGTRIVRSTDFGNTVGEPVAVDIVGGLDLELIAGCIIYGVNLGNRTQDSGSLTEINRVNNFHNRKEFSSTSVADYNQDGFLDIIASGSLGAKDANTTLFFWDVHNDVVTTFYDPDPSIIVALSCSNGNTAARYANGWQNGTGRLNIADLDGDGLLNVSFVSGKFLYALDENFELFWRVVINEETSGYTGSTLFDFNGDGQAEVVYRDERFLYIINGNNGEVYTQQACVARTAVEYPIVADLDADGASELCVTCGFDDVAAWDNFCNIGYSTNSHVRAFESAGEPWVPARRVWNQHAYFNVNVNDDLTIPIQQQKHHLVWSQGTCTVGPNRPLNSFLIQAPYLDTNGCPTFPAPDVRFVYNSLTVNSPTCPDQDFTVSFRLQNIGDISISGDFNISFYEGNPRFAGATLLNTQTITVNTLNPVNLDADTLDITKQFEVNDMVVTGTGSAFTLFIVLNDDGSTIPTPIAPNTTILECNYLNNILSSPVVPGPVSLTALLLQENIKCDANTPDNGAVRAFIPGGGGIENTTDYDFFWYNGGQPVAGPADFTGAIYSGLPAGDYTVFAIHKTANCNSDTVTVALTELVPDPADNAVIVLENPYDNCLNPNGALRVEMNGGTTPIGDYTYEWYEGPIVLSGPKVSVSHIATGLVPLTYSVLVTNKATGCESIATFDLNDDIVKPIPDIVTTDILCSGANTGALAATADGDQVAGYTFDWYNGNNVKPTPDFTGDIRSNLAAGNYTLVVTRNSSQCSSDPVTVTISQTVPPTVTASTIANQTSCDMALPNGSVLADVGAQTGLTVEWYTGQNTLPVNLIAGATTTSLDNLSPGVYTVKVTDPTTSCSATAEATVSFAVVTPSIIIGAIADFTSCNDPDGSITVNVTLDTPADYTFSWYDGPSVKATPDYPDTDNVLENLPPGEYTVRAVHNTKNCEAAPITATVLDNSAVTTITYTNNVTTYPSDCSSNDGAMEVTINAPGNSAGFLVEWFVGIEPFTTTPIFTETVSSSSTASNIASGVYSVRATNLDNGCPTVADFFLPFVNAQVLDFVAKSPVLDCSPTNTGSIEFSVTKSPDPPGAFSEADYRFEIHRGPEAPANLVDSFSGADGTINYTFNNLEPGFYTIVAISNNPITQDCKAYLPLIEIEHITTIPAIVATSIDANTNCVGATSSGRIELEIDGGAPATDYSFAWFQGATITSPVLPPANITGSGAIAQNLAPGQYTVEVTKTSGTSLQCSSVATFTIFNNPPVMSLASSDIQIEDFTRCDMNTSSATILSVSENGVAMPIANYTFEWFDAAMVSLQGPSAANTFAPPTPGNYFVRATNIVSLCATSELAFEIIDMTLGNPMVDLIAFTNPTLCLKPLNEAGSLEVLGNGSIPPAGGYTYRWYEGATATGPVIDNDALLDNIVVPGGQSSVTFTIEVLNNDNGCSITDTYTLPVEVAPITLSASAAPLTFCATDNGEVFATVTSGSSNDYTYNWYFGDAVKAVPDSIGKGATLLPAGNYTIVAVDNLEPTCQTLPQTVTVVDETITPQPTAIPLSDVTNCDPAKQNGAASASVDGDVINYTFDWYEGPVVTGIPIYTGAQAGNLGVGLYTIEARDIVTGCTGITQVTINESPIPVPLPQIEIVSHVTSCVMDNGILAASVDGNTKDYIFNWYIGTTVGAVPDFIGEKVDSLAAGTYTVTATSKITGCTSGPVSETIIEDPDFPDFEFKVESASCDEENGYISLFLTTNIDVGTIEWHQNGSFIAVGPNLSNASSGTYSVTVTSQLGCATTKDVEIKTDIHPYNYISRNGDTYNDRFYVNCIEEFPNNIVKIYNRAGTLVYEAPGYDNIDIYFDGIANRGIKALGDNLPDGTYFYIIDKRDGSKQLAGYLEIVN